jgi:hypothetical protein
MNFNTYAIATGIVELLIDISILALPTRTVFTLQMPLRTKIVLASIFMLGGLWVSQRSQRFSIELTFASAIITAILRIAYLYQKSSIFGTQFHKATKELPDCANK